MLETWLWIGCAGMTLGLVLIVALWRTVAPARRHHIVVSGFVVAIAALAYFAMANEQGLTTVDDRVIYYARYIDWALTTPLLLIGLMTVALPRLTSAAEARDRNAVVGGVIGADLIMIVTGAIAALSVDETVKYVWYAVGCIAFLVVLYAIFVPVRNSARERGPEIAALYDRLLAVLTVLWFTYPIVWLLGTEGTEVMSLTTEVGIFAVVDVLAKVGFGLLLVRGVASLPAPKVAGAPTPAAASS